MIGTKAQLIKMAPVILEMDTQSVPYKLILTGQHKETIEDLISSFGLRKPDGQLVNMQEANTSIKLFSWLIKAIYSGLRPSKKSFWNDNIKGVLVHGDTLSTLVTSVISRFRKIPVFHVEAGLRSYDFFHPFPEEIIRCLVSRLSSVHYCPDAWSYNNLKKMPNNSRKINTQANTLLDSLRHALSLASRADGEKYAIVSLHRYENISNSSRFNFLMQQVQLIAAKIRVYFVLHPATLLKLEHSKWKEIFQENSEINLLARMDYINFIQLLSNANFLVTDGGSNQEECSYLNIPCLLMRKKTERKEGLDCNVTISKYNCEVINHFIGKYSNERQSIKALPEQYPSKNIVKDLISHLQCVITH